MTGEFMREERYIVFKTSDLGNSLKGDEIRRLAREYAEQQRLKGKKPLECVVVEKDWPEYEPTWKAIEARATGAPCESAVQVAARLMNHELIAERDALRAKVAEMEQQKPVATVIKEGDSRYWMSERLWTFPDGKYPLYALPGAQTQGEEK